MWIDIEDASGVKLGSGPITSALGWERAWRLDQVGEWSFEMPALDEQRELVRLARYVRAWARSESGLLELGGGQIEELDLKVSADAPLLRVSGADRLRELANRTAGDLWLGEVTYAHPAFTCNQDGTGFWRCFDKDVGDATTYESFQLKPAPTYWVIADALPFQGIRVVLEGGGGNSFIADLLLEYWNGSAWTALTVTSDTTMVAGRPFWQSGDILWATPSGWTPRTSANVGLYELRISQSIDGDAIEVTDVSVIRETPTEDALERVMALVAGEWALDLVNGYGSTTPTQTTGSELLTRPNLNYITGTPDDGTSDTFDGWTRAGVNDGAGNKVEATTTAQSGSYAVKLTRTTNANEPELYQDVTVTEATDYLLTGYARGDGTARPRVLIEDRSHAAANQYLTARVSLPAATGYAAFAVPFTTPVGCTSVRVHLLSSDQYQAYGVVYFDNLSLLGLRQGGVLLQCAGESIFEVLTKIAEQTGEHFTLTPGGGQRVVWLRDAVRDSGLRVVVPGANVLKPNPPDDATPELAYIVTLDERQSRYQLATRVYPRGESLADATLALPSGFAVDAAENCLIYTTAETALGRIDKILDTSDTGITATGPEARRYRANAVLAQCYNWLVGHSATDTHPTTGNVPRNYGLHLVKCHRWVMPGYTVRLVYHRWRGGYHAVAIDADLFVLGATVTYSSQGVQTAALEVATVALHPVRSDAELLALEVRALRAARART